LAQRSREKKPKVELTDYEALMSQVDKQADGYDAEKDSNVTGFGEKDMRSERRADIFSKGTSKRIWGELYKVVDSSDVIIQVLDARDPMGTRCRHIEKMLTTEKKHKHLIFVLNKCDLVPTWATARWVRVLSEEFPTLAFHASITNPFGKGSLIQLLRQISSLHKDKKQISVGFIGYPNVGKSSVINTLKNKRVCKVAPIPGETKVWQYITLVKNIFLVDCPGIVYPTGETETQLVLKGVVRIENIGDATDHVAEVVKLVKKEYLCKSYQVYNWEDHVDFLSQFAKRSGRLLKGGDPDINTVAKMVLMDWQRGRIPFFVCPPEQDRPKNTPNENAKMQVNQQFKKISVSSEYNQEDQIGTDVGADVEDEKMDQETDEVIDWDQVYNDSADPEGEPLSDDDEEVEDGDAEAASDDDDVSLNADDQDSELSFDNDEEAEDSSSDEDNAQRGMFVRALPDITEQQIALPSKPTKNVLSPAPSSGRGANKRKRDFSDDEEDGQPKEKRMTTNKKKAKNYYTDANVKNKRSRRPANFRDKKVRYQTLVAKE